MVLVLTRLLSIILIIPYYKELNESDFMTEELEEVLKKENYNSIFLNIVAIGSVLYYSFIDKEVLLFCILINIYNVGFIIMEVQSNIIKKLNVLLERKA